MYLVSRSPVITGQDLRNARASRDEMGKWEAGFTLSQDGGKRFEAFTAVRTSETSWAWFWTRRLRSVATINSAISDSGAASPDWRANRKRQDLSLVMRSGSLPAGIRVSWKSGQLALRLARIRFIRASSRVIAGLAAVIVVMLIYYKFSGINAVLALLLNTIILIAALSYFHATLTLPGIAGIILTIGMAVDSNVLIFERIREELRSGKSIVSSVDGRFRESMVDHCGHARDHHRLVFIPVLVRDGFR